MLACHHACYYLLVSLCTWTWSPFYHDPLYQKQDMDMALTLYTKLLTNHIQTSSNFIHQSYTQISPYSSYTSYVVMNFIIANFLYINGRMWPKLTKGCMT